MRGVSDYQTLMRFKFCEHFPRLINGREPHWNLTSSDAGFRLQHPVTDRLDVNEKFWIAGRRFQAGSQKLDRNSVLLRSSPRVRAIETQRRTINVIISSHNKLRTERWQDDDMKVEKARLRDRTSRSPRSLLLGVHNAVRSRGYQITSCLGAKHDFAIELFGMTDKVRVFHFRNYLLAVHDLLADVEAG